MLEIILLYVMGGRMANKMRAKGRSPVPYVILMVALWFGGEVLGMLFGLGLFRAEEILLAYPFALVGAITGAALAFAVANGTPLAAGAVARP